MTAPLRGCSRLRRAGNHAGVPHHRNAPHAGDNQVDLAAHADAAPGGQAGQDGDGQGQGPAEIDLVGEEGHGGGGQDQGSEGGGEAGWAGILQLRRRAQTGLDRRGEECQEGAEPGAEGGPAEERHGDAGHDQGPISHEGDEEHGGDARLVEPGTPRVDGFGGVRRPRTVGRPGGVPERRAGRLDRPGGVDELDRIGGFESSGHRSSVNPTMLVGIPR